jgi:hypothetical protein
VPDIRVEDEIGFAFNGGVWVLDVSEGSINRDDYWNAGLGNALGMERGCDVPKGLGAKLCESFDAYSETAMFLVDIAVLLKDEVIIAERQVYLNRLDSLQY